MNRLSAALSLIAVTFLCTLGFGATEYVITNDNRVPGNTATVFKLDTTTGNLTKVTVLHTGGYGAGASIDFGNIEEAITSTGSCIFVEDADSSDIAAFSAATSYQKVGNYSNGAVEFGPIAGSLALTPNNDFLYASYGDSENIGAWQINSDCSLTFISAYTPSGGAEPLTAIKVTPNGAYLVVPLPNLRAELFSITQSGALRDIGFLELCNGERSCEPVGVDITKDSKLAVFGGNVGGASAAFTADITPAGLTNLKAFSLVNSLGLKQNTAPFLSAGAYAGAGNLYFGFSSDPTGVVTAAFTEKPANITLSNATLINSPRGYDGTISATGNIMVVAEFPNVVGVFAINSDGSLTSLSETTVENAVGLISVSLFPATR